MLILDFDITIWDHEKVRNLSERFSDEMPGILNSVIVALHRLVKNGTFTRSEGMLKEIENYKDMVDPMRQYIQNNLQLNKQSMIPKTLLYAHYREYIKTKGLHPLSECNFWIKIFEEVKDIEYGTSPVSIKHKYLPERSRVICGLFCIQSELDSFEYKNNVVNTKTINYDIKTKTIMLRKDLR